MVIAQKDFSLSDLQREEDKKFIEHIKTFYHGQFYVDAKIVKKNGEQFLRVIINRGSC